MWNMMTFRYDTHPKIEYRKPPLFEAMKPKNKI